MPRSDLQEARLYSQFISHWVERLGEDTFAGDEPTQWSPERLKNELSALLTLDEQGFWKGIRILRQRILVSLAAGDLMRRVPLDIVMNTMSDWAEAALWAALQFYTPRLMARYGTPRNAKGEQMELWVVGMGKLGGRELNVSSDIDLIFLYEDEGETEGENSVSHTEFFSELGKKVISVLNSLTEYGQVFRVDMRLRPYGDSGPLVMSLEALEEYFSTQGRLWERFAWIKSRLLNIGVSAEAAETFRHQVEPFVFRRYWDFDAYEGLRDMYAKIRAEGQRKDFTLHIKLGEGGIRYIEFIAQLFQLVRGGRKPELRCRSTLRTLSTLRDMGILEVSVADNLIADYRFLRELEHRLQYRADQHTHRLPDDEEGWEALTSIYPELPTVELLKEKIAAVKERVSGCFSTVLQLNASDSELGSLMIPAMAMPSQITQECLAEHFELYGLTQEVSARVSARIAEWMLSLRFRRLPERSQNSLEHVLPHLVKASLEYGEVALTRALDVLESISARSSYIALFREHPPVLDRLMRVLSASAWAGTYLKQYPLLLDELIHGIPDKESLDIVLAQAELERGIAQAAGEEQQMENLRHWQRIQTFRCLCCNVVGQLSIEAVSDYLSWTADQLIGAALRGAWKMLPQRHCDMPHMAVLAYGKLGGKELGYAGDIDIVFLYDDPFELAPVRYARLTQKWIHWMMALTPAGRLYEVDMRLRPEGESGLLIASWEAFERYQKERAHVWEHQALTRARWVAGDIGLKARFDELRQTVLTQQRDRAQLLQSIRGMRDKMRLQHPDIARNFDIKKSRGGLIDIEFAVQYIVLGWSHEDAALVGNIGNIALLLHSGKSGYIPDEIARDAADAYRELRAVQHQCQLQGVEASVPRNDPRVEKWQVAIEALYKALPTE